MSKASDLFEEINNAVLDLQGSQLQTFERPLKTLAQLLNHSDLTTINQTLKSRVDFDAFMTASERTAAVNTLGSHHLAWPDDREQVLGLFLCLIDKLAAEPRNAINIGRQYFDPVSNKIIAGVHALTRQMIIPYVRDYKTYVLNNGSAQMKVIVPKSNKVFVVHGRDDATKNEVALFLRSIGLEPIILHARPNGGRHILTKFQEESEGAGFAVILMTPDDEGALVGEPPQKRARQNVVFELGFFIGILDTANVAALVKGHIEKPSDFDGIGYIDFDSKGEWKRLLAREMHHVQVPFDLSKVLTA